tara:strand:- start:1312 stop:2061 length:750 start_codon:yes stop_codon:yes gene_type:complete
MKKIKHPHGNFRSFLLKFIKRLFEKILRFFVSFVCKLDNYDEIIISTATHVPWRKDKNFFQFYKKIKRFTLLDPPRSYTLWQCAKNLQNTNGQILDIGCMMGGAGFIMSKRNKKGNSYLFDSFSGFKKDDGLHKKDVFYYDEIEEVKRNIKKLKLKKTFVFKAYFPKRIKVNIKNIKLCHIDVNTFGDTKLIFNFIDKKIIKGGIIVFDDFGIWGVNGIKKFIYSIEKKFEKKYYFFKNYMGQCILIKK